MADAHLTLNGHALTRAYLCVPGQGPWFADCDLADESADITQTARAAKLQIGSAQWVGTVTPDHDGTWGGARRLRVVGGAAGWRRMLSALSYVNDAGVSGLVVAQDAARAVGESLDPAVVVARLPSHYVRPAGVASRVIEDAARGVPWWVGSDGVTRIAQRSAGPLPASEFTITSYDPRDCTVELAIDDLSLVQIGGTITHDTLDRVLTVRSFEATASAKGIRVRAWCPQDTPTVSQLTDTLRSIVTRMTDGQLHGIYEYRVGQLNGDRVDLQPVRSSDGLPNCTAVSMRPGVAGAHARLALGTTVLVQFISGDRGRPVITAFAGKDGQQHVPQELILCAGGLRAGRQGDLVQSGGPGTTVTFTPVVPAGPNMTPGTPYLVSFDAIAPTPILAKPLYGVVATGAPITKIG